MTSLPINSLSRHIEPLLPELQAAAARVIGSGHFVLGPWVSAFEREFADYCGVADCIGVANGTDAIELALKGVGVESGDEVIVAANAAMYSTSAVIACGAIPVFADIRDDATLDPAQVEACLAAGTRVRAVVLTHLYGRLGDVEAIARLCKAAGAALIEDCAQAHGATRGGIRAGAFGDAASFSFYPTKNLGALGDGGAVVTRRADVAERVRMLRQYGWSGKYNNLLPGGRNSRLDEIQAAMLSVMVPHLDGWNARRRAVATRYSQGITNARIRCPAAGGGDYVAHLYVVRCEQRDALRAHLAERQIQSDVHYPLPDHRQASHQGRFDSVRLPCTEGQAMEVLTLPCFPEMVDDEIAQVIDACNSF